MYAGMTPSVGFSDITDGSQSPSCNICVAKLLFEYLYDVSRWNFLSDIQGTGNSINSAIELNDNSIDILGVKYEEHPWPNRYSWKATHQAVSCCAGLWLLSLVLIVNIVCILFLYLLSTFVVN